MVVENVIYNHPGYMLTSLSLDPSADQEEHEQEQQRQSAQSQLQENLRNILSQHAVQSSEPSSLDHEPLALEDVLTPDIISPLFEDPRLREIFFEHLPEETPKTEASIRSVTSTPYFRNVSEKYLRQRAKLIFN